MKVTFQKWNIDLHHTFNLIIIHCKCFFLSFSANPPNNTGHDRQKVLKTNKLVGAVVQPTAAGGSNAHHPIHSAENKGDEEEAKLNTTVTPVLSTGERFQSGKLYSITHCRRGMFISIVILIR